VQWTSQLITVVAVLAGAASTYLLGRLSDRDRYARELRLRWDQRRLDAYTAYVTAAKMVGASANAILSLRLRGISEDDLAGRIDELARLELRRTEAFEALPMLADGATIEAAHMLNEAVWHLERSARLGEAPAEEKWLSSADQWITALNNFHAAARDCLSVIGTYSRRDVAALAVDRPERRAASVAGTGDQQASGLAEHS
jgi:hypothetical protein